MQSVTSVHSVSESIPSGPVRPSVEWDELFESDGTPREVYRPLLNRLNLPRIELRRLGEQLEATMREMGVTFDIVRDCPWGRRPWFCDLAPQIFTADEWKPLDAGVKQRVHAYECFLRDVYGEARILRQGTIPVQQVLGSAHYQRAACGLPVPEGAYLHVAGIAVGREPDGRIVVKHHYFSHASGISYMIQNRRALARVIPQSFQDYSLHSISDTPTDILEQLRCLSADSDPMVVLLSPGQGSAVYSEHSFLARRMGIPLVQGGDLLVHNDHVYLKTVSGLERVHAIYNRIADQWLDPLAFRRDSRLGVPGLVHCIRKGTVVMINAVGSQLVDDRTLLPFAPALIRYYLGEIPILDELETYWLGDLDQRAIVLDDFEQFVIRPVYGERILSMPGGGPVDERKKQLVIQEVLENPAAYVAQPTTCEAVTLCYDAGRKEPGKQDHILFALRRGENDYTVFPGALTRLSSEDTPFTASELGGGSKDTWVLSGDQYDYDTAPRVALETRLPANHVTSRVAESFYWIGRYLERARNLAGMISVIEALETEELNPTERMHYRPVWNRMLPPLDGERSSRRTISSAQDRYRLTLDLEESGAVIRAVQHATWNGESVLECLSLEAWGVLSKLRNRFEKRKFRAELPDEKCAAVTRSLCNDTTDLVAQFFGTAQTTMIADGGWSFCEVGESIERAITTAHALNSMMKSLVRSPGRDREHAREIQMSAFLRLLSCRDVYRRVYQMRIESSAVLQMLWQNPMVPRSVTRCMQRCLQLIDTQQNQPSAATIRMVGGIETLLNQINQVDWERLAELEIEDGPVSESSRRTATDSELLMHLQLLLEGTQELHHIVTDGFLNHQIHMRPPEQPLLAGFGNAI
jgi:uncharacterized circularly permuted ATP-grasp superfamily protein/uncharacterized alpha-E superfamily protein